MNMNQRITLVSNIDTSSNFSSRFKSTYNVEPTTKTSKSRQNITTQHYLPDNSQIYYNLPHQDVPTNTSSYQRIQHPQPLHQNQETNATSHYPYSIPNHNLSNNLETLQRQSSHRIGVKNDYENNPSNINNQRMELNHSQVPYPFTYTTNPTVQSVSSSSQVLDNSNYGNVDRLTHYEQTSNHPYQTQIQPQLHTKHQNTAQYENINLPSLHTSFVSDEAIFAQKIRTKSGHDKVKRKYDKNQEHNNLNPQYTHSSDQLPGTHLIPKQQQYQQQQYQQQQYQQQQYQQHPQQQHQKQQPNDIILDKKPEKLEGKQFRQKLQHALSFKSRFGVLSTGPIPSEIAEKVCLVNVTPLHICNSAAHPLPLPPILSFEGISLNHHDALFGNLRYDEKIDDLIGTQHHQYNPWYLHFSSTFSTYGSLCFYKTMLLEFEQITFFDYINSFETPAGMYFIIILRINFIQTYMSTFYSIYSVLLMCYIFISKVTLFFISYFSMLNQPKYYIKYIIIFNTIILLVVKL